jgi:hypothetical protein
VRERDVPMTETRMRTAVAAFLASVAACQPRPCECVVTVVAPAEAPRPHLVEGLTATSTETGTGWSVPMVPGEWLQTIPVYSAAFPVPVRLLPGPDGGAR